ncbi:ribbon-helix-helix protein, CopG family [Vulcanococcus sp. Clear-D1]|uniref:ribbon-helix-helix protein, CopG family n=1 Tax=Vulcanococcus sp. Clear-D1 TaxID=2766970 RepID=UPI0019B41BC2|nr:ribbon-helix-helix protein, CopG family [Vulcanococcus sp. Clear-D1]MBD1194364.1 ribbon-helix-helix protein, CopG family [Vulcanococcus sp. Clear-D1]
MDPTKLPRTLDLELSAEAMEWLLTTAQQTGRCEEELILEILDRALQSRNPGQNSPESESP